MRGRRKRKLTQLAEVAEAAAVLCVCLRRSAEQRKEGRGQTKWNEGDLQEKKNAGGKSRGRF